MKHRLKYLKNYKIKTKDEESGDIKDFLFDEHSWKVRYAEADFGSFFSAKRLLVPRVFLGEPDESESEIPAAIVKDKIASCPAPDAHFPVSREFEIKMNQYYEIDNYWAPDVLPPAGATGTYFPPRPLHPPEKVRDEVSEDDVNSKLRSFKEIKGYDIKAQDGTFGEVYDLIIDSEDYQIVYLIIDTEGWLPWSKKVQIPISYLSSISYAYERINMNLTKESLKNAPEFDAKKIREEQHEKTVFEFFADLPGLDMK
jgi:sporulation protein YlmC with PRC-barrel domain